MMMIPDENTTEITPLDAAVLTVETQRLLHVATATARHILAESEEILGEKSNETDHSLQSFLRALSLCRKAAVKLYKGAESIPKISEPAKKIIDKTLSGDVELYVENDVIFVRIPLLWAKNFKQTYSKKELEIDSVFFRNEIEKAMRHAIDAGQIDVRKYDKKIIYFLFVCDQNTAKTKSFPDNDNRCTKHIQDALTTFFPGGDSAFSCSTFLSASATERIPEACLATIFPFPNSVFTSEKIIDFWASKTPVFERHKQGKT